MRFIGFLIIIVVITSVCCSIVKSKQSKELKVVGYSQSINKVIQDNNLKTSTVHFTELLEMIK
ncbi:MAG: hypothetical protein V3V14_01220 [Saprospiraceae bacterium]